MAKKYRKTLNEKILKYEIEVYCATMANFWNDKSDKMYSESKQAINTIIDLMVYYFGSDEKELIQFVRKNLIAFVQVDQNVEISEILKEF